MSQDISNLIRRVNAAEPGAQDALFTTALVHESCLRFTHGGQLRRDDRRACC
ncbi:MAG: hypothetical protein IPP87_07460 [Ideonella sp.]|nr:hypothetical protein [Ideonella sp.]